MIRDSADLLPKKCRYGRERSFDINLVSLELLDALGKELVVMDKWPQKSVDQRRQGIALAFKNNSHCHYMHMHNFSV